MNNTITDFLVGKVPLPVKEPAPKIEIKTRMARDLKPGDKIKNASGQPIEIMQVGRHESAPMCTIIVTKDQRLATIGLDWPVEVLVNADAS